MSHESQYVPPPPSQGAPPKQVAIFFALALALASFVLYAINESRDSIIEVGAFLIVLGLVFGTGMISKTSIIQFIAAGVMMFGGGIAIGLGIRDYGFFWYIGALLFFICAVIIVIKDQLAET
jgi:hypothetical protein